MNTQSRYYRVSSVRNILASFIVLALLFTSVQPFQVAYAMEYGYQGKSGTTTGGKDHNSIKMLDPNPSDITVLSANDEGFTNQINRTFNGTDPISFKFIMSAGQNNYNETNFQIQSMPHIKVYDETETKIVASYAYGNAGNKLKYLGGQSNTGSHDETGWIKIGMDADTLSSGNYVLYFGPSIGGNNPEKTLGVYLKFKFTVKGLSLSDALTEVEALTANSNIGTNWGQYPQNAVDTLIAAANTARSSLSGTEEQQKAAANILSDAIEVYKDARLVQVNSVKIDNKPSSVEVGTKGTATATVSVNPNEDQYKGVTWTASSNITIDANSGAWEVNSGGTSYITATTVKGTTGTNVKQTDTWNFNVSQYDNNGMLIINIPSRINNLKELINQTGVAPGSINKLKITASGGTSLTDDDIKYIKDNLTTLEYLDIKDSRLTGISSNLFKNVTNLKSIVLPSTATFIGIQSFSGCTGLSEVVFPAALQSIGKLAFEKCTALPSTLKVKVSRPPTLWSINGEHSFEGTNVQTIAVPYSCKSAYEKASSWSKFATFTELPEVKLTVNLTASGTFQQRAEVIMNGQNLTSEDINTLVISTSGTAKLTRNEDNAYLQNNFMYVSTIDMSGAETEDHKCNANYFKDRVSLKKIILPPDTETIGSSAFSGCTGLSDITIPAKITKIGSGAFSGCISLPSKIIINAVTPPEYDGSPFDPDVVKTFIVPNKSVNIYKQSAGWSAFDIQPQVKLTINQSSLTMNVTDTKTLTATVTALGDNSKDVVWSSSDTKVATVNQSGKVTAIRAGTANIIADSINGGAEAICKVTVRGVAAPIWKSVSANYNTVKLSWNTVNDASGYEVYRAASVGGNYTRLTTLTSSQTKYDNIGLKSDTTYYYKVRAFKDINGTRYQGDYSTIISAKTTKSKTFTPIKTTPVKPPSKKAVKKPGKPTKVKAKAKGKKKIQISWKKVKGAKGYVIYRSTKKSKGYKKIKTVSSKTSKFTNKKLKKGKKYYYKVRAYKKSGKKKIYSAYSKITSCKAK